MMAPRKLSTRTAYAYATSAKTHSLSVYFFKLGDVQTLLNFGFFSRTYSPEEPRPQFTASGHRLQSIRRPKPHFTGDYPVNVAIKYNVHRLFLTFLASLNDRQHIFIRCSDDHQGLMWNPR